MSLKMTTQFHWQKYANYSRYHPDNPRRPEFKLPEPIVPPQPVLQLNKIDKEVNGAWGHTLCCERAYGPVESKTRIKDSVSAKVGSNWQRTVGFEKGQSVSQSAMYGTSWRDQSFEEIVEMRAGQP